MAAVIRCRGLGKAFRVGTVRTLGGLLRPAETRLHWALRNLDLEVEEGASLALLGPNGCGKTTLLRLIAGILNPTEGSVEVTRPVVPIFQWGLGFQELLSGRENAVLYAALLGTPARAFRPRLGAVEAFAGLSGFLDAPVRQYSTGMRARLAVATALNALGEGILVLDEALAVGDAAFSAQCEAAFLELKRQGRTLILTSHNPETVARFSDRAVSLGQPAV